MAQAHVLDSPRAGQYHMVLHFMVPAGNNAAGVAWKTVLQSVYPAETLTAASTGEQAQRDSGDLMEIDGIIQLEPSAMTTAQAQARIAEYAAARIASWQAEFARAYRYYGYTQGTVS